MSLQTVRCSKCKTPVVYSAREEMNGKNYHVACAKEIRDRKAFLDYLDQKAKGYIHWPTVTSQIKTFMRKHKLTYEDLLLAARYQYEVLQPKGPRNSEHAKGIGLLPYIMQDAKEYWGKQQEKREKIIQQLQNMPEERAITVTISPKEAKKQYIDPMSIFEEE